MKNIKKYSATVHECKWNGTNKTEMMNFLKKYNLPIDYMYEKYDNSHLFYFNKLLEIGNSVVIIPECEHYYIKD